MTKEGENQVQQTERDRLKEESEKIITRLKEETDLDIKEINKKIPVMEVFGPTIQGEGMLIGNPTVFLRTGLCDYRCKRCDSLHAVLPDLVREKAMWLNQAEIAVMLGVILENRPTPVITLSGGNPVVHNLQPLMEINRLGLIAESSRAFALETQGTLWHDWVLSCQFITISPKGPGMGEKFEPKLFGKWMQKMQLFAGPWCVKVPVFDQRDLELIVEINQSWPTTKSRTYISVGNVNPPAPALRENEDEELTIAAFRAQVMKNYEQICNSVMTDSRLAGTPILPQLHTLIWGNAACR